MPTLPVLRKGRLPPESITAELLADNFRRGLARDPTVDPFHRYWLSLMFRMEISCRWSRALAMVYSAASPAFALVLPEESAERAREAMPEVMAMERTILQEIRDRKLSSISWSNPSRDVTLDDLRVEITRTGIEAETVHEEVSRVIPVLKEGRCSYGIRTAEDVPQPTGQVLDEAHALRHARTVKKLMAFDEDTAAVSRRIDEWLDGFGEAMKSEIIARARSTL